VLIPKGKAANASEGMKARPICLVDDVAKIFERIIVHRLWEFMEGTPSSGLSDRQYGFRQGRSTVDALDSVMSSIYHWTNRGYFAVAVGLDIRNAFNSIPWTTIRCALRRKNFPRYIRRIIDCYLHNRSVEFPVRGG